MISVGVMVLVCASLSLLCVLIWFLRCRRYQLRHKKGRGDRQRDMDSYQDKQTSKSISKRAVADKEQPPKRTEFVEGERPVKKNSCHRNDSSLQQQKAKDNESKNEQPAPQTYAPKPLERIKEETTPIRNKRLDTVSVMASIETLQRNDSKANVFPADKLEEIDLNPGLNSVINLETI